jgi:hypothetical protein
MIVLSALAGVLLLADTGTREIAPRDTGDLRPSSSVVSTSTDEALPAIPQLSVPRWQPSGLTLLQDTIVRRRPKAVVYSDWYSRRVTIHKTLSWAMLPLFAASYLSGNELINKGGDAPEWAETLHAPAAAATAAVFGANALTGTWNLWEGRKDPNGRVRRVVHSVLFMAASGGFAYTGTQLAEEAEQSLERRRSHRNLALASMGASTASWLIMLIGN